MIHNEKPAQKGCVCPRLNYDQWEGRHISFDKKRFLSRTIPLAFHLPVGLKDEIDAIREKAEKLHLEPSLPPMLLQRDLGLFKGELLWGIDTDIGEQESSLLSGKYLTTVHRGPYVHLGKAVKAFIKKIRRELGIKPEEVLYWYANCPQCWHEQEGPVTILMGRIGNAEVASESP